MRKSIALFIGLFLLCASLSAQIDQGLLLDAINALRSDGCTCGRSNLKPTTTLQWDKALAAVAKSYADHLQQVNQEENNMLFLSHVGSDESTLESRLDSAGYQYVNAVENIACQMNDENMVIDFWLNNPESCRNIMNRYSTVMGAARTRNFWVLIIAQPKINKLKSNN